VPALLPAIFFFAATAVAPNEIDGATFHAAAPVAFSPPVSEAVDTPWGPATMSQWSALDRMGVSYVFSTFALRAAQQPATRRLREARLYFLHNRKCVAQDVRATPMQSADGVAWPQAVFAGNCAAGEAFRAVTLIAGERVYQLQAMVSVTYAPPSSNEPASSAGEPLTLDEALARFVRQCRFDLTH